MGRWTWSAAEHAQDYVSLLLRRVVASSRRVDGTGSRRRPLRAGAEQSVAAMENGLEV
jgi:hypothetical protein